MAATWKARHQGSPQIVQGLTFSQLVTGLEDGRWEVTDEVMGPNDTKWIAIESHPQLIEIAMELEPEPPRPQEDETRLDMNALIDVTLVLLIFFILTTTRAAALQKIIPLPTIDVNKETGAKVYRAADVEKYMVHVKAYADESGKPVVKIGEQTIDAVGEDGKSIDTEKLRGLFQPFFKVDPTKTEMVLEARQITWGDVVAIQDAAKGAGVRVVHHLRQKQ